MRWPSLGSQIPAIVLMSVDLPAPLSPTSAVTWPGGNVEVHPAERADTGPKFFPMPRSWRSAPSPVATPELLAGLGWADLGWADLGWAELGWPAPDGARPAFAGRAPSSGLPVTAGVPVDHAIHPQPEIPAAVHALAKLPEQSWDAGTNLSAMTVEFMFAVVTHFGVSRTEATDCLVCGSVVVPLSRLAGGVAPARTYMARAAAAWASR